MSVLDDVLNSISNHEDEFRRAREVISRSAPILERGTRWTPPTPEQVASALHQWHSHRRFEYGKATIDARHTCTVATCVKTGSIVCISDPMRLYGCTNSGRHHVCRADDHCTTSYVNDEGQNFCTLSHTFLHTYVDRSKYGEDIQSHENTTTHVRGAGEDVLAAPDVESAPAEPAWTSMMSSSAGIDQSEIEAIKKTTRYGMHVLGVGRDLRLLHEATHIEARVAENNKPSKPHTARLEIDGTEEVDTIEAPTRRKELESSSAVAAAAAAAAAAPLALGDVSHAAPPPDAPTTQDLSVLHGSVGTSSAPDILVEHWTRYTRHDIENIVAALFVPSYRSARCADIQQESDSNAEGLLRKYYRRCVEARVYPNAHVRDALCAECEDAQPRLTPPPGSDLDTDRLKRYTAFVYELWRILLHTPLFKIDYNRFRLSAHVLGALYMLMEPFTMAASDGSLFDTILDRDPFLVEHLPAQVLLRTWEVPIVTYSTSRVLAVKGAVGRRVPFSKSAVSSGRNTIKHALLSIVEDEERVAVRERLRAAYTDGTYEKDDVVFVNKD